VEIVIEKIENKFRIVEVGITAVLFVAALMYEAIHFPRAYQFIISFILFAGLIIMRYRMDKISTSNKKSQVYILISYMISIVIVVSLEYNSRYIINYFIHILYILLLLELSVTLKEIKNLWVGMLIILAGMYKYTVLVTYKPAISTYAEALFFLLLNLMSLFVITLMYGIRAEQTKLQEANKKLEDYAGQVEHLTEVKTRADIAGQIHDGIGHNLTALIMQLEMTSHVVEYDVESAKKLLEDAKTTARNNLVEIRKAVKTMDMREPELDLDTLIRRFSIQTGVKISWEIDLEILKSNEEHICIYRTIQEALTNAVRHGKATDIKILLKENTECEGPLGRGGVLLTIKDNGHVIEPIEFGFGLKKMHARFENLNGSLNMQVNKGLELKGYIPHAELDMEDER